MGRGNRKFRHLGAVACWSLKNLRSSTKSLVWCRYSTRRSSSKDLVFLDHTDQTCRRYNSATKQTTASRVASPPASVDHVLLLVLAAELATLTPGRGERCSPRAARCHAPLVANVDHVCLPVVFAELGVAVAVHRERSLLDARRFFAPRPDLEGD